MPWNTFNYICVINCQDYIMYAVDRYRGMDIILMNGNNKIVDIKLGAHVFLK
jgi:hypothetical protein